MISEVTVESLLRSRPKVPRIESAIPRESRFGPPPYWVSPYVGCSFGCAYCSARYTEDSFAGGGAWGRDVEVRVNAPEVLARELGETQVSGVLHLAPLSDPYQPVEERYGLTRAILRILRRRSIPATILTRSTLILRDLDVLREMPGVDVGFSVSTMDPDVQSVLEPGSPGPAEKLEAMRALREAGIHTWVYLQPILPGVTDVERILEALAGKIDSLQAGTYHDEEKNLSFLAPVLERHFPEEYRFFMAHAFDDAYWDEMGATVRELARRHGIPLDGWFRHDLRIRWMKENGVSPRLPV